MKGKAIRLVVAGIVMLGLAIPGAAFAAGDGKDCKNTGTWFGVNNPVDKVPTGWVVTSTGQSANHGTAVLEYKTFKSTMFGLPQPHDMSADRGVWTRLGGNRFAYSFMAIAVNEANDILYLARVSGEITISDDCMSEEISALLEIFYPGSSNPFAGDEADWQMDLPTHWGYRYTLN